MIPFNDLRRQNDPIAAELKAAMDQVVDSGRYILGEQVEAFEQEFAEFLGVTHCIGAASGTEALQLALMAIGVQLCDEVIAPANTCVPTIAAIVAAGAVPVLADVDPETLTLDAASVDRCVSPKTRAIVPVHLYGHPCDMTALQALASENGIALVEDCAQAHGALFNGTPCGTFGAAAAFSFYPTKNLGALGDGGAIVTNDAERAQRIRHLGQYGRAEGYAHPTVGINSRLDEMQAAVLRVKLKELDRWNAERNDIASRYQSELKHDKVKLLPVASHAIPNHHLLVVRSAHRESLQRHLAGAGVGTAIHYPQPIHALEAYSHLGNPGAFPHAERACREVLSLPLYPGMPADHVDAVIEAVNRFRP